MDDVALSPGHGWRCHCEDLTRNRANTLQILWCSALKRNNKTNQIEFLDTRPYCQLASTVGESVYDADLKLLHTTLNV